MMCLSCQLVLKLSIIAWFEINQDYIAANLCENKARPELVCCGKCVLTKQLKKADNNERKESAPVKIDKTNMVVFILPEIFQQTKPFAANFISVQNAIQASHFSIVFSQAIFHPPSFIYS